MNGGIVYSLSGLDPFALALGGKWNNDPLCFRKQLIYVGKNFRKHDAEGRVVQEFDVTPELINHWAHTHRLMLSDGIEVPTPKEHTLDSAERRGTLVDVEPGYDSKNRYSLFGVVKFRDEQAAREHKDSQISVYVPPRVDQQGKTYWAPITHAALTDYPVITGMDKFKALAASLITDQVLKMADHPLRAMARKLKIADTVPDTELETAIETLATAPKQPEGSSSNPENVVPEVKAAEQPPAVAAALIRQLTQGRETQRVALSRKISKPVLDKLAPMLFSKEAVALSLSNDSMGNLQADLIDALSLQPDLPQFKGEKTGAQSVNGTDGLKLSKDDGDTGSSDRMVKAAKKLADKAKARE